nr:nucleoside deaminase [Pelagicoccus sp. SDUM812003]
MLSHLRACNEVAAIAVANGNHPFGAVLVAPDDEEILLTQGNVDTVRHAETELSRYASSLFPSDYLWNCTLVSSFEPCAMCSGTLYWANIGQLVYGVSEKRLLEVTGSDDRNPTLSLTCRNVLRSGQKRIKIHGPFPEIEDELLSLHADFWHH